MSKKFSKLDEDVIHIFTLLYMRGYSFANVLDILQGESLINVFIDKLYKDVYSIKKYVNKNDFYSKDELLDFLKNNNEIELISIIENVLKELNSVEKKTKRIKNLIIDLENDIKEINILRNKENQEIKIPKKVNRKCYLYRELQDSNYKYLAKLKMDPCSLKDRNEDMIIRINDFILSKWFISGIDYHFFLTKFLII